VHDPPRFGPFDLLANSAYYARSLLKDCCGRATVDNVMPPRMELPPMLLPAPMR
jgi:hypothetical protein